MATGIAVHNGARLWRSGDDGLTWVEVADGSAWGSGNFPLHAVAHGGGRWLAVGDSGMIEGSDDDGFTWFDVRFATWSLYDITYHDGVFIAVGGGGEIIRSDDLGATWQQAWDRDGGTQNNNFNGVAWIGDRWLAAGTTVLTSQDGWNWTNHGAEMPYEFYDAAHDGQGLALVSGVRHDIDGTALYSSQDGGPWTKEVFEPTGDTLGSGFWLDHIEYGGGQWAAMSSGAVSISPDGQAWTVGFQHPDYALRGFDYSGSRWVFGGFDPAQSNVSLIYTSEDGVTWNPAQVPADTWGVQALAFEESVPPPEPVQAPVFSRRIERGFTDWESAGRQQPAGVSRRGWQ